jgi:hypothetical protein
VSPQQAITTSGGGELRLFAHPPLLEPAPHVDFGLAQLADRFAHCRSGHKAVLDVGDGQGTAADSVECPDTQGGVKCPSARWPTELLLFSAVLSRPE